MAGAGVDTVGVVGAGLMGTGIAVQLALAGCRVRVLDSEPGRLEQLPGTVTRILTALRDAGLVERGASEAAQALISADSDDAALCDVGWVSEAVPEVLELKHGVYGRLEAVLPVDAVIASNTSGFLPSRLGEPLRHPERFLVAHFWNPPHAVPLVEVVPGRATGQDAIDRTMDLLGRTRADVVLLQHEIPGFIGNRLQFALLREALNIVRSGAATPADVDRVMTASLGRRYAVLGPFETADLGGLDTFLDIASHLMPDLAKDEEVLEVLRARVQAGDVGWRSGRGFHDWPPERLATVIAQRDADLLRRVRKDRVGEDRVGEDRVGEDRVGEDRVGEDRDVGRGAGTTSGDDA